MKYINIILLVLVGFYQTSCMPLFFTAAASTTIASAKDRSFGETIDDIKISTRIKKEFISQGFKSLYSRINVQVVQGRVLLTGYVDNKDDIMKAVEIGWSAYGVREVINELKISDDSNKFSPSQYAKDTWITSRINSSIFFRRNIKFANYTIVTHRNIVYLFGIARNEEELQDVIKISSEVSGVERVISYVHLKNETENKIENMESVLQENNFEELDVDIKNSAESNFNY